MFAYRTPSSSPNRLICLGSISLFAHAFSLLFAMFWHNLLLARLLFSFLLPLLDMTQMRTPFFGANLEFLFLPICSVVQFFHTDTVVQDPTRCLSEAAIDNSGTLPRIIGALCHSLGTCFACSAFIQLALL